MPHPLVVQLRFTRTEFQRALEGLTDEDAQRRIGPMNCISWNIGHLAWQEQRYWLRMGQDQTLLPQLNEQFANGAPACIPALAEAWEAWHTVIAASDPWLDTLTTADLQREVPNAFRPGILFGSLMLRVIYHYWYHTGENMAIRQMLGYTKLPDFVGNLDGKAPYVAE